MRKVFVRLALDAGIWLVVMGLGFVVVAGIHSVSTHAQEQAPAAQSAPSADPAKEIAALRQQLAQLQQQTKPTPNQLTKQAQDGYAAVFKEAKEKANPGCRAAGGRLRATVLEGKVSIACEW